MGIFDDVLDNVGKEWQGGKGFEAGTHTVIIGEAEATTDAKDRDIIRVTVFDPEDNDKTAECTLWFHTEKGANMAVAKVLGLLVHNQPEEKKEAVRTLGKRLFGSIDSPAKGRDAALKLLQEKLTGKEGYLVVTINNPKYDTSRYGDLWHYAVEPKVKDDEVTEDADDNEDLDI